MKHNYPKHRKPNIKPNSQKRLLMANYPLEHIEQTWIEHGMYKGAELLNNSNPFVLYHLARECKWRRPLPAHLVKALNDGCWKLTERYYIEKKGGEE